jgi:hypothetical protein
VASFHVREQLGPGEAEQWPDKVSLDWLHSRETRRSASPKCAQQYGLGLVVCVMSGEDPPRVVSLPHPAQPTISRLPRLGLTGLGSQSKPRGHERESGEAGELAYPHGDVTTFQGNTVVRVRDQEVEVVRLPALQQEVEQGDRIRPARHRDNGAGRLDVEGSEVGYEAVLHESKIIED